MTGKRLSHYEILAEISRGGMGVVYRAVDLNLGREVALKVLPDELLHDRDRRERLLQEARAAAVLEHPHIGVIHEVGESDGVTFIAMELIRGEKLSEALSRAPLPQPRALALAAEIAGKSPHAIRGIKRLLNEAPGRSFADQFADERKTIGALIGSKNQVEAVTAYFEKRDPVFDD